MDIFGDDSMETTIISSVDFSESDYVFIDSDGVQSICDENSTPYALCTHIMEDGKFLLILVIPPVGVLLRYILVKNVKNVDIELMLNIMQLIHMQNALIKLKI